MKACGCASGLSRSEADGGLSKQADKLPRIPLCGWPLLRAHQPDLPTVGQLAPRAAYTLPCSPPGIFIFPLFPFFPIFTAI